jgi:hypothetical protein
MIWDLIKGKYLTHHEYDSSVNSVLFSQKLCWVIVATNEGIKVFDLKTGKNIIDIRETSLLGNEK